MADQATIHGVAEKFQTWAQSLSEEEQATVAEWLKSARGDEVSAYTTSESWWQEPNAWSKAWTTGW